MDLASCREAEAATTARADRLQERVSELEAAAKRLRTRADAMRTYDLSHEQLVAMAERCELAWDTLPVTLDEPQTVSKSAVTDLGLNDDQIAAINATFAATNARLLAATTALYVEATGDTAPSGMAPEAMFAEIVDKTPRARVKEVFQRLSAERAGLAAPPSDPSLADPIERLFRLATGAGDQLERDLAAKIGSRGCATCGR